jgi:3-oxoacyl-[acyl-carrier protein] reductase
MGTELAGRVALVTGSSRGIGAGIARALAAQDVKVAINYNASHEKAIEVCRGITDAGGTAEAYSADMAKPADIRKMFGDVEAALGPVDILVNNAGIHQHLPIEELSYEDWLRVVQVNLNAAFVSCQRAIPGMKERGWGRIINISSINAFGGTSVECHYGATKAGIVGLTKALALETASDGITVNAIAPGAIDTDMLNADAPGRRERLQANIPVGRLGLPEDIAHAAVFLASPKASFVTGQVIHVNGGEGLF